MKCKTISYLVYKPNYIPGDGYHKVDTKRKAFKLAVKLGSGAEVHQDCKTKHHDGSGMWGSLDCWEVVHDKYFDEYQRNFNQKICHGSTRRVCDVNSKYVPIYRKWK